MNIDTLHEEYPEFFEKIAHTESTITAGGYPQDHIFYMAIDAEWYAECNKNIVLSYQIATSSADNTKNIIEYMRPKKRLKLGEIIELGLKSVTTVESFKELRKKKNLVILISHNVTAEWSVLADRNNPEIIKKLSQVRQSPITGRSPIKISINKEIPVDVLIFDTMLLAPASHKSLKKLSTLIGSEEGMKDDVTHHYITNMNLYLRDHPEKFEKYALKDSAITLKLFFIIQQILNDLVDENEIIKFYRTLASAAVRSFQNNNPYFHNYTIALKKKYPNENRLIKRSYYGGRNEAYFVGHTDDCSDTKNKIWIDIDLIGCYPTAMALCPKIDLKKDIIYLPAQYKITESTESKLIADNVPKNIIRMVKIALTDPFEAVESILKNIEDKVILRRVQETISDYDNRIPGNEVQYKMTGQIEAKLKTDNVPKDIIYDLKIALEEPGVALDNVMSRIKKKSNKESIREAVTLYDNTLINKWYKQWKTAKKTGEYAEIDEISIPGFARIRFKFPPDTIYPCLPIRHVDYGLLFVLEGETIAPANEIMLAMEAGAKIEAIISFELPIELYKDENGVEKHKKNKPIQFTFDHLAKLARDRKEYQNKKKKYPQDTKAEAMQMFLKEFTNSLYGKFAQAINKRKIFKMATEELEYLARVSYLSKP
jgi:hypothetical protein